MKRSNNTVLQRLLEESSLLCPRQSIDPLLLKNMLGRHYGLSGIVEPLDSEKGDTFRLKVDGDKFLGKVSPSDEPAAVTAMQIAAMRHLNDTAHLLPIQRIKVTLDQRDAVSVRLGDGTSRLLSVFCFVEGALWEQTHTNVEHLIKLGEMLGRLNNALRSFEHSAAKRGLVYDIANFHHWAELVERTSDPKHKLLAQRAFRLSEERLLPRLPGLECQVIHGDYAPNNVVVDPHSETFVKAILDFGDAVFSAVIFDPANAVAHLIGRSQEHPWNSAFSFVAGYEQRRPIKESELPLLPVAAIARLTMLALVRHWKAERAPGQRDELFASAEYYWGNLERAMAVPLDEVIASFSHPDR